MEQLEQRLLLASDWQNACNRFDVNDNGMVSPLDALLVINQLARNEGDYTPPPATPENYPPYFVDVTGNGPVSPIDALNVINELARNGTYGDVLPPATELHESGSSFVIEHRCSVILHEGDQFETSFAKSFIVPEDATTLEFSYEVNFDTTDPDFINDAFEVALVDELGNPLATAFQTDRDAFFNVTESAGIVAGDGTTFTDTGVGTKVSVDVTDVLAGEQASLIFRLINDDQDGLSTVRIVEVSEFLADPKFTSSASTDAQRNRRENTAGQPLPLAFGDFNLTAAGPIAITAGAPFERSEVVEPEPLNAEIEWSKQTFSVRPDSRQVMMTPAVIDINQDDIPDIVFSTFSGRIDRDGLLRAISGTDGSEIWTLSDSRYQVAGQSGVAVADIDGDGLPEIIAGHESNRLMAVEHDGTFKWLSPSLPGGVRWGSAAIANLDGEGLPEIVLGATVLNATGQIVWTGDEGRGSNGEGPLSTVADLDLDGKPELIAGRTAYRNDGTLYWNAPILDGFPALGNFDDDLFPEVVVVSQGWVHLVEHDGALTWSTSIPGAGRGGAPTVADFDGDGEPEIGVAGANRYAVFESDGSLKWDSGTRDGSSVTGSSVFDFDGDGRAEAVYGDELYLRIYDGTTGEERLRFPKGSGTTYELPVIVDVDADGIAEIVGVANDYAYRPEGGQNGIYVYGDANWVETRQIWNQHSYHITNVNDDGTIPRYEANSWEVYNNYRRNQQPTGTELGPPTISVSSPNSQFPIGERVVLSGFARAQGTRSDGTANRIEWVSVNGRPVDVLDTAGNFFIVADIHSIENSFEFSATDSTGQVVSAVLTLHGTSDENAINFSRFSDIAGSFSSLYGRTSFEDAQSILHVDLSTRNDGSFETDVPLLVGIKNISDPAVSVIGADGVSPEGIPYYDFTGLVSGGTLRTSEVTEALGIQFYNPNRGQFDYELVFWGKLNEAPVIESIPPIEAFNDRDYVYDVDASDADGDTLTYSLSVFPAGMQVDPATGEIHWSPGTDDHGYHDVTVTVDDGRGGIATQRFTLSVATAPPNRPPIITSTPVTEATIVPFEERAVPGRIFVGHDVNTLSTSLAGSNEESFAIQVAGWLTENTDRKLLLLEPNPADPARDYASGVEGALTANGFDVTVNSDYSIDLNALQAFNAVFVGEASPSAFVDNQSLIDYVLGGGSVYLFGGVGGASSSVIEATGWRPFLNEFGLGFAESYNGLNNATITSNHPTLDGLGVLRNANGQNIVDLNPDDDLGRVIQGDASVGLYAVYDKQSTFRISNSYSYDVEAIDPDFDPIEYTLLDAPEGMEIDPASGLITWAPAVSRDTPPDTQSTYDVPGFHTSVYVDIDAPFDMVFDSLGNLYVGNDGSGDPAAPQFIRRIDPLGQVSNFGDSTISDPDSVAFDLAGTISGVPESILVGGQPGIITAVEPDQDVRPIFGPSSTINNVTSLDFDRIGRLIFIAYDTASIMVSRGETPSVLTTVPAATYALAIDPNNRIFLSSEAGTIRVYESDGTLVDDAFATDQGFAPPMSFGPGGAWGTDLYLINNDTDQLLRFDQDGAATVIGTGFTERIADLRFGPDGALYLSSAEADHILRIEPTQATLGLSPNEHRVLVAATDGRGGVANQEFIVCVHPDPSNHDPVIISDPVTEVVVDPDALIVELEFDSLPSEQGWEYRNDGNGSAEGNIFSVDGMTLFQDSLASPDGSAANNSYLYSADIDPERPFTVEMRVRVMEQNGDPSRHKGFGFVVGTGEEVVILSLGPQEIQNPRLDNTEDVLDSTIDNTQFHDYRLEVTPRVGASLFVDGEFIAEFTLEAQVSDSRILLGDLSASNNARAEVTRFRFSQASSSHQDTYRYDVGAIDPDNDTLTYSLINGPNGMTVDSASGLVQWSPTIATISQTLGDEDFFGIGSGAIGEDVPSMDFDNSTADDPLFTDRDLRPSVFGNDDQNDIAWTHDFRDLLSDMELRTVSSVRIELPIGGIQDGDPATEDLDDRVFVEGTEIAAAFDNIDQGAVGTGLITFALTSQQVRAFKQDGVLDIFIDGGRISSSGAIESYFIDYSKVDVDFMPSPNVTVGVTDGRGGFDQQSFSIEVRESGSGEIRGRKTRAHAPVSIYHASSGNLPSEIDPAWELLDDTSSGAFSVADGVLTLSTASQDNYAHFSQFAPLVDTARPFHVEVEVRFVEGTTSSGDREPIGIGITTDDSVGIVLYIGQDSVFLASSGGTGPKVSIDTDDAFHTYRMEYDGSGGVTVFYDGQEILSGSTSTRTDLYGSRQRIVWGDLTNAAGGTSQWRSVTHNALADGQGLSDWTIYLDQNQNGIRDSGEQWTLTDENGDYAFTGLPEGTYYVREELQPGWVQTWPRTDDSAAITHITTFDDGLEGWTMQNQLDAEFSWQNSSGNPGGFAQFVDANQDNSNFISAPTTILGDWSGLNQVGEISYDHAQFEAGPDNEFFPFQIVLSGPGGKATYSQEHPGTLGQWHTVTARLDESQWNMESGTWTDLLAEVTQFDVRIEVLDNNSTLGDRAGIDNIRVSQMTSPGCTGAQRTSIVAQHYVVALTDNDIVSCVDFANRMLPATGNTSPTINSIPSETSSAAQLYRYDAAASDSDSDPLQYSLLIAPDGMTIHPTLGTVVWTPAHDQAGSHEVLLRVSDGRGGSDAQVFNITVAPENNAPILTSTPGSSAVAGETYEYLIRTQDADDDYVSVMFASVLSSDFTLTPVGLLNAEGEVFDRYHRLTWNVPSDAAGTQFTIDLVASDSLGGSNTQSFAIDVLDAASVNRDPLIHSSAPTTVRQGATWLYAVQASDPDSDPVQYAIADGPLGLSVSSKGVAIWSPPVDAEGSYPVELLVGDGRGGVGSQSFELVVIPNAGNESPQVASRPPLEAIAGQTYRYDPIATDPDGDAVTWRLDAAPRGMSIDPHSGKIRWTPDGQQIGTHLVAVTATDPLLASATQPFEIHVGCSNLPPAIVSVPPTLAVSERMYLYPVRADDFENDTLTWSLGQAPEGMSIDESTGVIRWIAAASQIGSHDVLIEVNDGINTATQSYTLVVGDSDETEVANRAPIITTNPVFSGEVDSLYQYAVKAIDLDGDAITFSLAGDVPPAMEMDASGNITWTPELDDVGEYAITVQATDVNGATSTQGYLLSITENLPPEINTTPVTNVVSGATYRYTVGASDPENGPLRFELTEAPDGMTIDSRGRILWKTSAGDVDAQNVAVVVTDDRGQSASDAWQITLLADTQAPTVSLAVISENVVSYEETQLDQGSDYTVRVLATDNVGVAGIELTVNGVPVALGTAGLVSLTASDLGEIALAANAVDSAGNEATTELTIHVVDPADNNVPSDDDPDLPTKPDSDPTDNLEPIVTITSPAIGASITDVTPIIGTVDDPEDNLWYYQVLYARADKVSLTNIDLDDPDWVLLKTSADEVIDGELAVFDPSLVTNDSYVIAVEAYDSNGQGYVQPTVVNVEGNLQLGNFRLELTDLSLPLAGIPINVTRVYDTLDADEEGDFGYGWKLGVQDARIFEATALGTGGAFTPGNDKFVPGVTKVYLTNPAGRRIGFTYDITDIQASFFGATARPIFVPDPGVYDSLSIDTTSVAVGGILGALGGGINPDNYTLTTKEGRRYRYNQFSGLQTITDLNGNTVSFSEDGISHSSGQSIEFVRDHRGRIKTVIDPAGNTIQYEYNLNGDLVKSTNQAGLATRYEYLDTPEHFLDKAYDSLDRKVMEAIYEQDSETRFYEFKGIFDALGNRIDSRDFDTDQNTGVIRDGNDNATTLIFDDRGNVLQEVDPSGEITYREYNDLNNPDAETRIIDRRGFITDQEFDSRGNVMKIIERGTADKPFDQPIVTAFTYDSGNRVRSITNPLGHVTRFDYDHVGNLTKITNAEDNSSSLTYDSQGRRETFTDFNGNTTTYDYTDACPCGSPSKVTYADGAYQTFRYNQFGQVTEDATYEADGTLVEYRKTTYDQSGRVIEQQTGIEGDPHHPPTIVRSVYDGHLLDWEIIVNPASPDETPATPVADRQSRITDYEYDEKDRVIRQIDAEAWWNPATQRYENRAGEERGVVEFRYDGNDNRILLQDPVGNITTWVFDTLNRVAEERDPFYNEGLSIEEAIEALSVESGADLDTDTGAPHVRAFAYDGEGNQVEIIDRNGRRREFDYDYASRLTEERWYNESDHATDPLALVNTLSFTYDAVGNMLTAKDVNSHYVHTYDALNRLTSVDNNPEGELDLPRVILTYDYDAQGNVTMTSDDAGVTVESEYDTRNRLAVRKWYDADIPTGEDPDVDPVRVDFLYTAAGRESDVFRYSGLDNDPTNLVGRTERTYDTTGKSNLLTHLNATDELLAGYDYDYDFSGLLTAEDRTHQDPQHAQSITYGYDLTGQLTDAIFSGQDNEHYEYDANGNRITSSVGDEARTYSTGPANQLDSDGVYDYLYDGEGNQIKRVDRATGETRTFQYDHHNRLVRVDDWSSDPGDPNDPSGGAILLQSVEYTYDAMGRRIARSVRNDSGSSETTTKEHHVYNGDNVWADFDESSEVETRYLFGNLIDQNLVRYSAFDGFVFYLADRQGTIRDFGDSLGEFLSRIQYTSFGQADLMSNPKDSGRYLFQGREHDYETGGYYFRTRTYSPVTGVFTSQDRLRFYSGDQNLYRFVINGPTNGFDPFGEAVVIEQNLKIAEVRARFIAQRIAARELARRRAARLATENLLCIAGIFGISRGLPNVPSDIALIFGIFACTLRNIPRP